MRTGTVHNRSYVRRVETFPQTSQEEQTVHLIAADTAFQLAHERRERLELDFPRRRRRRRLRRRPR